MLTSSSGQRLAQGIGALRAGDREQARELLIDVVQQDPGSLQAWLWLSGALDDTDDQRYCLERVLEIDPQHPAALRGLALLPASAAASYLPDWSSAGQTTTKLALTPDLLAPPAAPFAPPDPPAQAALGAPPPASDVAALLGDAAAVELVLREIGGQRQSDELVRRVAEFRRLSWDEAQEFVALVQHTHAGHIQAGRRRTAIVLGGMALLGVLIFAAVLLVAQQRSAALGITPRSSLASNRDWQGALMIMVGIFTASGGLLDLDIVLRHGRARLVTAILGRRAARVLYSVLGSALLAYGVYTAFIVP